MNNLVELIENLKKNPVKKIIDQRMNEFEELGKRDSNEIFKELCFCFLTANFSADRSIKIQKEINDGFLHFQKGELAEKLNKLGHRFPNARANFVIEARKYKDSIKGILNSFENEKQIRQWIVKNIKGMGLKESSHFLRNIGYKDVAIIDFHIVDLLTRSGLIEPLKSKSLTPKKYLEIEDLLKKLSKKTNTNLGELDLYLWYEETGKILK